MKFKSMYRDEEFELNNCPFCGSEPKIKHIGNELTKTRTIEISCSRCQAVKTEKAIHKSMSWLEDIAVQGWNMNPKKDKR